ncbi:MAG: hypothetical protein LAO23_17380 [Acidobacteriia bacterium]|nr:hypothetical protein [Terriglobia bacterium]
MPATRKTEEFTADLAERGVLAHIEHLKAVGEAMTEAANTLLKEHRASKAVGDWRDDLGKNLADAGQEFHKSLTASLQRVSDAYFGEKVKDQANPEWEKPPEERPIS